MSGAHVRQVVQDVRAAIAADGESSAFVTVPEWAVVPNVALRMSRFGPIVVPLTEKRLREGLPRDCSATPT